MTPAIAIVGMACRYADADSPMALWENTLAQRQAFRRLPPERLDLADYFSDDPHAPDCTYATEAAVLEGYEFDRVAFRVAGPTFRSVDLTHWLALQVASEALQDAGFPEGVGLPCETTGVLLGNTLTGEFSRANMMRLRWPYVRRRVSAALQEAGWDAAQRREFLERLEHAYKEPFPPVNEETLAGGLANTIAGRICNYFDLHGGGYTVDGACASSLLAAASACAALELGDLDVALVGGVDLSLDPFELIGFAKTGALAPEQMRVYDRRSAGFWPGEGCGVVVLMRQADALAQGRRIYALIRGWGISSDGSGGITRPEVEGQLLAVRRAYRRAGFGIETVGYFEGHGTGTSVGDATELRMLTRARREVAGSTSSAVISSIKANIGHTKAAAGVAGLIKAVMALDAQILPPMAGCAMPHETLAEPGAQLRVLHQGELWRGDVPLRAGVSAMGFGGINTHLVLEGSTKPARAELTPAEQDMLASFQDAEIFFFAAADATLLQQQLAPIQALASRLSRADLVDLAAELARRAGHHNVRAAVVAATPAELAERLAVLQDGLNGGSDQLLDLQAGVFLGRVSGAPRIGFLFPGQGAPSYLDGGLWRRRFRDVAQLYERAALPTQADGVSTAVAQPAIVTASLSALQTLERLGVRSELAIGHSLGELSGLHWAGALDEKSLLELAGVRGRAMAELGSSTGAMASIRAGQQEVKRLLNGDPVSIACLNSPRQTVVSGAASAVALAVERAQARGLHATRLPVSHAFHSPLVAAAAGPLADHLARMSLRPLRRTLISTVTGAALPADADIPALLCQQVVAPVRFAEAALLGDSQIDLWIEVGPGRILSEMVADFLGAPAVALDAGGPSLHGLLLALGAAFVLGAPVQPTMLFADRFSRPFDPDRPLHFLANPCEQAPSLDLLVVPTVGYSAADQDASSGRDDAPSLPAAQPSTGVPLEVLRQLLAERVEIPLEAVHPDDHLLRDLHLNSISVSQIIAETARRLCLRPPTALGDYASATVAEAAEALGRLADLEASGSISPEASEPAGVDSWIRPFTLVLEPRPLLRRPWPQSSGEWQVLAEADHPLASPLQAKLAQVSVGQGVIVCLPPNPSERHVSLLMQGARISLQASGESWFVLVQEESGAAGLARTLHLENPQINVCVVQLPFGHPDAADWIVAEALATQGYVEAHYDQDGQRYEPFLRLLPLESGQSDLLLGSDDVLLVTGGGKGITAECALAIAQANGVRLGIIGRSVPEQDAELSANLARFAAHGVTAWYVSADITDPVAVQRAVDGISRQLGPITGILHGAARNEPRLLRVLDEADLERTLAPKVGGLRALLDAIPGEQLRLLVTFGSIIARIGLPGEADYALANEWLTHMTETFQRSHPACRCLALEWSVWADVGMGARLGRIEALTRQGITPIPPDEGVALMRRLLAQTLSAVAVVVTGRYGSPPTLRLAQPELPLLRFLDQVRVFYPGVELIADVELSSATDPYLDDHMVQGERLLPGVLGLEAMAQAAAALVRTQQPLAFEEIRFLRPIALPPEGRLVIRIAALARSATVVDLTIRCAETLFQVDHFRARCRFGVSPAASEFRQATEQLSGLLPARDLYGSVLFHQGRFQRLSAYFQLSSTHCEAEISPTPGSGWFSQYLPTTLLLGDPGVRDASIHAIQVCVPHRTLLPVGVERLWVVRPDATGPRRVVAVERSSDGDSFLYDVDLYDHSGQLVERWEGLHLRALGPATTAPMAPALLGPYLERRLSECFPGAPIHAVVVQSEQEVERRTRSDQAIWQALGRRLPVWRRPDGRPETADARTVSASHAACLTFAVAGGAELACDIELVKERPEQVWRDVLGVERFALVQLLVRDCGIELDQAATRVWAAAECLIKAGVQHRTPLLYSQATPDGCVVFEAGSLRVATLVVLVQGLAEPIVLAVLAESEPIEAGARLAVEAGMVPLWS
ncbi:MAG: type I polyketide synthase [Roseiflexaceae bacterium]